MSGAVPGDPKAAVRLDVLPGGDLVEAGLAALAQGRESIEALLVASFATKLRMLGLDVPEHSISAPETRLYLRLQAELGDGAHARYNALIQRLVSFADCFRCAT